MIQNKHIIRLSFIGLFLNIIANMILYRYFMIEEIVLKQVSTQNTRIASLYQKSVWEPHLSGAVNKLKTKPYKDLLQDTDFIRFAQDTIKFFNNLNAKVSLFDMSGNKIITNYTNTISKRDLSSNNLYESGLAKIDHYFLKSLIEEPLIDNSFWGKTENVIIPNILIEGGPSENTSAVFIRSYIPIIDSNFKDFIIDGVIEINHDVTEQWDNINYLQYRVFITFIVIFCIFFVIIMYNTHHAQKIINQQYETNRALEEAKVRAETESSAKTEFLANVSHELRTPLNAIIGFSEIMLAEKHGKIENAQYAGYVQDINNSGNHLLSVINDILDFSKASADKLKVDHIELDLNKLASTSLRFVQPRAESAKIRLIEKLPSEHIIIYADPKRLKQVLLNLLSNSVKFTPENGSITLEVKSDEAERIVYIKVQDTGIGISDKDIPKALSIFGQVDNKLNRKYEGTGLGLPLTKKLVELMQGTFDIQSEVGVGTTITLAFRYDSSVSV